ncbi:MAG: hypothetical protein WBX25_04690, partial [Rhodomicrobium sp.]
AAVIVVVTIAVLGSAERGTEVALQLSARFAFLVFFPAYVGGAPTTFFGPTFKPLKQYGREFGFAFAAALSVHLGLVAWLCHIGFTPGHSTFIFFGGAATCTYILAIFSVGRLQRRIGRKSWWLLRTVALNYIAYAFFVDFWKPPFLSSVNHLLGYSAFAMLSVIGPLLRLAAFVRYLVYFGSKSIRQGPATN